MILNGCLHDFEIHHIGAMIKTCIIRHPTSFVTPWWDEPPIR